MASSNSTDVILTTTADDNRWSANPPPDVDWQDHKWPHGQTPGDIFWAAHFRCTVKHFHGLVRRKNWEHVQIGRVIYVDADYLLQRLQAEARLKRERIELLTTPPTEAPATSPRKKKRPHAPPPRQP